MCTLWRCGNILILLKQGVAKSCLLHNTNSRYSDIKNLKIPQGTIKIAVPVLFLGNVENPKQHALTRLQGKRGIPCNKAYLSKYNLRFINKAEPFPE